MYTFCTFCSFLEKIFKNHRGPSKCIHFVHFVHFEIYFICASREAGNLKIILYDIKNWEKEGY